MSSAGEFIQSGEFWAGFVSSLGLLLVVGTCIWVCGRCCSGGNSRNYQKERIEFTLEDIENTRTNEVYLHGEAFSVEHNNGSIILTQKSAPNKPRPESQFRISRLIPSRNKGGFPMGRKGPRFSNFYSGNTSSHDEESTVNHKLFTKNTDGTEESDKDLSNSDKEKGNKPVAQRTTSTASKGMPKPPQPMAPVSMPRDSGSTALSKYLKHGLNLAEVKGGSSDHFPSEMISIQDDFEGPGPSNLLRHSPETTANNSRNKSQNEHQEI